MAFIWKHPQSKYFMARFVDLDGRRRNRSTKSSNRKEAQKIADAYEATTRKKRTAKQVRNVILELHQEITGEELPSQSFRAFSEAWLDRKKPEVADTTWVFYKKTVLKFTEFLLGKSDVEMSEITSADVLRFRNQSSDNLAAKTVNHDLKCLRMIFKAARQDKAITEDPSEFVSSTKKVATRVRRPFTIAELQSVIAVADDEWKSIIRFGVYTGQRLGDIARLQWSNIDIEKEEIRMVARKTNKALVLPIAAPLKEHLQSMQAQKGRDGPVHVGAFAKVSKQGRSANLSNQFSDLLAKAGLRKKAPRGKVATKAGRGSARETAELSFHSLRHTTVSIMKDAGVPEAAAKEIAGHDSSQMSAHDTHVGLDSLKKAAASLPSL